MHKLCDAPGSAEEDLKRQIEAAAGKGRVYVLGLGNTDRGDDGAGILVAQELRKPFPHYSFSEHDGVEGTVLDITEKKEESTVFFVDAADIKEPPGTIRMIRREDIRDTEITTHRVAVALMSSILERAGKRSAVLAIQPKNIGFQAEVTGEVKKAIACVVASLDRIMRARDS